MLYTLYRPFTRPTFTCCVSQRLIPAEVDRFLCCGPSYQALRNGVTQALLDTHTDPLQTTLQVSVLTTHPWNIEM